MGKKKILIAGGIVLSLLIIALVLFFTVFKKDSYRLIKVFEVDGEANVFRENIGDIEPYNNMVLESGDKVALDTGKLDLQADEDKFIYLEEGTELVLKAAGNSENSKTTIELLKGAVTNDIQNKLSKDSSYEINTPNSTMSVRGTVFRVYIYVENGIKYTKVSVFDGKVSTRLIYKDGKISTNEVVVEKGKEVLIYEDDKTTDYVSAPTDIDYSQLPESVIELLIDVIDEGRNLIPTKEELEALLSKYVTVTFVYNGSTFGSQTIKKGTKAVKPKLKPAATGSWKWDFSQTIDKDTTIEWQ